MKLNKAIDEEYDAMKDSDEWAEVVFDNGIKGLLFMEYMDCVYFKPEDIIPLLDKYFKKTGNTLWNVRDKYKAVFNDRGQVLYYASTSAPAYEKGYLIHVWADIAEWMCGDCIYVEQNEEPK